jgi:Uma2 family endonuclease
MVQSGRLHRYTYVDYVALEESSPTKHEYFQGEIYAMAGGSEEHSALAAEVLRALGSYQTIPSLRDYLVVSHRERRITVHSRTSDGGWATRVAISGGKLTLTSLASELRVDGIYRASAIA